MKMILAFIPPHRLDKVTRGLLHVTHLPGVTVTDARGFGREKVEGQGDDTRSDLTDFTPAVRLETVVPDALVEMIVEEIVEAAHTGNRGDGKIFILPVEDAVRIKTRSRGAVAV